MRHTVNIPVHARPKSDPLDTSVRRVMVGTDRSETADQAVRWAASFAERYGAELIVVQVVVSQSPAVTEYGARRTHPNARRRRGARQVRQPAHGGARSCAGHRR